MNPFLSNKPKDIEGYDSLETESSKNESNDKKHQDKLNSNDSAKITAPNSDDKIQEINKDSSKDSFPNKIIEENPSEFRASFPSNQKEEKKKRYSKAFERFKKRYSAMTIKEEKKEVKEVKSSEKIKNIVAMLEKQLKGEIVEENINEENHKNYLEKRNTVIQNDIFMMRNTFGKIKKKKGTRPSIVNIE